MRLPDIPSPARPPSHGMYRGLSAEHLDQLAFALCQQAISQQCWTFLPEHLAALSEQREIAIAARMR